jgi:hypothetical protein
VGFRGEHGIVLGPRQEFFTLVSREFASDSRRMWRQGVGVVLFPIPEAPPELLFALGARLGKALQQERLVDIHRSHAFFMLVLGVEEDVAEIDSEVSNDLGECDGLICFDFMFRDHSTLAQRPMSQKTEHSFATAYWAPPSERTLAGLSQNPYLVEITEGSNHH